jgi:ribosome maturation factor RimP
LFLDDFFTAAGATLAIFGRHQETSERVARTLLQHKERLATRHREDYIRAILIRVRRTSQAKRVGRKPALFIWPAAGPPDRRNCSETKDRVTELESRIEAIVAPTVVGMGYEMVRVALGRGGNLQIMAEPADGRAMTVEDCATLSRAVSAVLDVEDPIPEGYTLEVSSPGIDRPLTRPKDYARWAGHTARLETAEPIEGRRRFKGRLLGLAGDAVKVRLEDGAEALVPLAAIFRAKLEMTDALIEEHRLAQSGAAEAH